MDFLFHRVYRGPLKMVVLDWAGTTVDFGCFAPAGVFVRVFAEMGVEISMREAREPMGLHKRDHIRAISHMERVAAAWVEQHSRSVAKQTSRLFPTRAPTVGCLRSCPTHLRSPPALL